jgi:hypothetical protein
LVGVLIGDASLRGVLRRWKAVVGLRYKGVTFFELLVLKMLSDKILENK